jgi:Acetyltransferase (GNAT) domain
MSSSLPADNQQPAPHFCCYQLDPIQDPRWAHLVQTHCKASVFHTVAWLRALRRTYGYEPVAFTTSPPTSELKNGIVFCRVHSWLTGRRLVSLPFSDHCEPLCDSAEDVNFLIRYVQTALEHGDWKYLQVRPINEDFSQAGDGIGCLPSAVYFLHTLDLRPDLDTVFRGLDKDSVQRRIQRAGRAGLVERCGRSEELLKEFYGLFVITRRRQRMPPTPYAWFRNVIDELGEALEIRVAYKDETPIAAIITLRLKEIVYYKYGCSDARFNQFGATPWLFWKAITAAKSIGAKQFDMGRTEQDNPGLLAFKNHWVPHPKRLVYWQYPYTSTHDSAGSWQLKLAKRVFPLVPDRLLTILGKWIYRHVG